MSSDSRLAVTANDDCTLKIFSLQGLDLTIESKMKVWQLSAIVLFSLQTIRFLLRCFCLKWYQRGDRKPTKMLRGSPMMD